MDSLTRSMKHEEKKFYLFYKMNYFLKKNFRNELFEEIEEIENRKTIR